MAFDFSDHLTRYLRRLQEAAAAAAAQNEGGQSPNGAMSISLPQSSPISHTTSSLPNIVHPSPSVASPYLEHPNGNSLGAHHPFAHSVPPPTNGVPIPPSRYPIAADSYQTHHSTPVTPSVSYVDPRLSEPSASPPSTNGRPSTASTVSSNHSSSPSYTRAIGSPPRDFPPYPLYNWSSPIKHGVTTTQLHAPSLPPLSYYVRPHRLEDVAPRETLLLIISLFFDFVYPLTPCIHKPSFMADLQSRREERDPLFFALVMSTVASTCVQVPRSYLPMERREVRKLAQNCHEASRHISVASYDPPTSTHVVIRYLCVVITNLTIRYF